MALIEKLSNIANAIRGKTGKTGAMTLEQMVAEINAIPTGSTDVPFKYGGKNATKISTYSYQWTLADTSFVIGSSASTSATSIKATVSNMYTTPDSPTASYGDNDIIVVQTCYTKPTYGSGATGKAQQIQYALRYISWFSKRKTTNTSNRTTRQAYSTSFYLNQYYNTSAAVTRAVANYGFYMTPQTPAVSSSTSSSMYIKCSSPILYYRASSTYLSTTNIKTVTECTFDWVIDVYAVDAFSTITSVLNSDLDEIVVNGAIQ